MINSAEIKSMSIRERLRAMETIWDSLLEEENSIESPEWHQKVLSDRKKKIDSGKAEFTPVKELRQN